MNIAGKMTADQICQEISGELEDAARGLSGGMLDPEQFRSLVEELERQKLNRHGFKLQSQVIGSIVHFSLRFADTNEVCANMDVNPETGKLVRQKGCR